MADGLPPDPFPVDPPPPAAAPPGGAHGRQPSRSSPLLPTGAGAGAGAGGEKPEKGKGTSRGVGKVWGGGGGGGAARRSPSRSADGGAAMGGRAKSSGAGLFSKTASNGRGGAGFFSFGAAAAEFDESEFGRSSSADGSPARMIAFVNPSSGGNQGAALMRELQRLLGEEHVYNIKADRGPQRGLAAHASDPTCEVRVLIGGGDGTFSWVATAVDEQGLRNVRLVIIPLGSGNDMARALGWGRKAPLMSQLPTYVDWARKAPTRVLDVWRLDAEHAPGAVGAGSQDSEGVTHDSRPLMCNYLSLGADAHVELVFNKRRWEAPEKYKTRLGNLKAHAVVGLQYITSQKMIRVADHVESLTVDGKPIKLPQNLQALIFCNIPSYGAGTQPWGFPRGKSKPMLVNDGFFEVIGLRSLHHFNRMKTTNAHGVRICQGNKMQITLKSDRTPFQVDGEPWEQLGGTVSLSAGNPVGVLPGPRFSHRSRKNAKFNAIGDAMEDSADGLAVGIPEGTVDDIGIGSPRNDRGPSPSGEQGPSLESSRPPASFG